MGDNWDGDPAKGCGIVLLIALVSFLIMAGLALMFLWNYIHA